MSEAQVVRAGHGEKAETVAAIHRRLKSAKMAIVTEYRGLSVAQMTRLRREIRDASGEYQVIKNTLVRRALDGTAFGDLEKLLEGPNGWVFAYDDPVVLSKALVKFAGGHDPGPIALPEPQQVDGDETAGQSESSGPFDQAGTPPSERPRPGPRESGAPESGAPKPFLPPEPPIRLGSDSAAPHVPGPWDSKR